MKEIAPGIVVNPAIRFGKPIIQGTRVPVNLVVERLAAGATFEELEKEYDLTQEQIRHALAYAAEVIAGEQVAVTR